MRYENMGVAQMDCAKDLAQPMGISDNLKLRRARLEQQLEDINAAIAAIEKNPEVLQAFNALSKVSHGLLG